MLWVEQAFSSSSFTFVKKPLLEWVMSLFLLVVFSNPQLYWAMCSWLLLLFVIDPSFFLVVCCRSYCYEWSELFFFFFFFCYKAHTRPSNVLFFCCCIFKAVTRGSDVFLDAPIVCYGASLFFFFLLLLLLWMNQSCCFSSFSFVTKWLLDQVMSLFLFVVLSKPSLEEVMCSWLLLLFVIDQAYFSSCLSPLLLLWVE